MKPEQVKQMIYELNRITDKSGKFKGSVFLVHHRGGTQESYTLQPNAKIKIVNNFLKSKIFDVNERFVDAIVETLIEVGFFAKPKTEKEITLAVNIILTFIDTENPAWSIAFIKSRIEREA